MKQIPINIGIANEHALFRAGLIQIINTNTNYTVCLEAANGQEFLNRLSESDSPPKICIINVNMPLMNGYDTARAIKKLYPQTKILALSPYPDQRIIKLLFKNGVNGYINQNVTPQTLLYALEALCKYDYYYPKELTNIVVNSVFQNHTVEISKKEYLFLTECCKEKTYKEIARDTNSNLREVEWIRDSLFKKMNTRSRVGLILCALKMGFVHIH